MDDTEVIAVLLAGYDDDGVECATVVLRDAAGKVRLKQMAAHEDLGAQVVNADRFLHDKVVVSR